MAKISSTHLSKYFDIRTWHWMKILLFKSWYSVYEFCLIRTYTNRVKTIGRDPLARSKSKSWRAWLIHPHPSRLLFLFFSVLYWAILTEQFATHPLLWHIGFLFFYISYRSFLFHLCWITLTRRFASCSLLWDMRYLFFFYCFSSILCWVILTQWFALHPLLRRI